MSKSFSSSTRFTLPAVRSESVMRATEPLTRERDRPADDGDRAGAAVTLASTPGATICGWCPSSTNFSARCEMWLLTPPDDGPVVGRDDGDLHRWSRLGCVRTAVPACGARG